MGVRSVCLGLSQLRLIRFCHGRWGRDRGNIAVWWVILRSVSGHLSFPSASTVFPKLAPSPPMLGMSTVKPRAGPLRDLEDLVALLDHLSGTSSTLAANRATRRRFPASPMHPVISMVR